MNKIAMLLLLFVSMGSVSRAQQNATESSNLVSSKNENLSYKIIPSANNTWGYQIYMNKKLKIHQPTIPGQPGKEGFKTKESAETVAELVIVKMKKGEMPPTITHYDLKNLGVL